MLAHFSIKFHIFSLNQETSILNKKLLLLINSPSLSEGFDFIFEHFAHLKTNEHLKIFSSGLEILWELFANENWGKILIDKNINSEQIHYLCEFLDLKTRTNEALLLLRECARRNQGRVNLLLQNDLYKFELKIQGKDPLDNPKDAHCFCPFESLWIGPDGECRFCFWSASIGNIKKASLKEIWTGQTAKNYRQAMLEGSYFFCNHILCYRIRKKDLPSKNDFFKRIPKNKIEEYINGIVEPREYELSYDLSCPHSCPSCRKDECHPDLEILSTEEKNKLTNTLLNETKNLRRVLLSCYGEFFYSAPLMHFLDQIDLNKNPELEFHLLSDGSFFTPQNYDRLKRLEGKIKRVYISLDSLISDNYKTIRPQSHLSQVLENLNFLSQLRRNNQIKEFMIVTTVQKNNYVELTELIKKALDLSVDEIRFKRLRQKGTFTPQEFAAKDICDPEHPCHNLLLEKLKHPLFNYPQVNLIDILY